MRFTGDFEGLKQKLKPVLQGENWIDLNDNQKQFRHKNGVVINWYPTTGTIMLQGTASEKGAIQEAIKNALEDDSNPSAVNYESIRKSDGDASGISKVTDLMGTDEVIDGKYSDSELVIGLVNAVGTEQSYVVDIIKDRLKAYKYKTEVIHVSKDVISQLCVSLKNVHCSEFKRIEEFIELGNLARKESGDNSILALGAASEIMKKRERDASTIKPKKRTAYIISSLKHPEEVERLREIYSNGFFLIGVYSEERRRYDNLVNNKRMSADEAEKLISRDMDEVDGYGQHTRDTFQMADFFVHLDNNSDQIKNSVWRILDLIFGNPFLTPTFDEFAMFMAFTSALRSADLSRQVGAVVAKDNEIIASGANDCPKAGGGLYWPKFDKETNAVIDEPNGRDYARGEDSNKIEQAKIIDDIIQCLELSEDAKKKISKSKIRDITEYGRVVHAEMEALLMCARNNMSARGATIYCTTFPCHNCAKHIIAAGIKRVIYVEAYPKSKAFEFHADSISPREVEGSKVVEFLPFVGIGPRKFFDLFSTSLGSGYNMIRKDRTGHTIKWEPEIAKLRCQMLPYSYLEREASATKSFYEKRGEINA